MNKDPDVVPEQTPLIISNSKSAVCKDNNRKDTKQTRHISRVMHFGGNGEKWNLHKTIWCEGSILWSDIGNNNVREDELDPGLLYTTVTLAKL